MYRHFHSSSHSPSRQTSPPAVHRQQPATVVSKRTITYSGETIQLEVLASRHLNDGKEEI